MSRFLPPGTVSFEAGAVLLKAAFLAGVVLFFPVGRSANAAVSAVSAEAAQDAVEVVEGGVSPDGRFRLVRPASPVPAWVRVEESSTAAEIARLPLARVRLPDADAPPCVAIWHPGGQWFALLDHEHKLSTSLSIYALHDGKAVRLTVPDYVQNALGRVDATEATLPCMSKAGLWNENALSVILVFNAPDRDGKWVMHNAVANLRVVAKEGRLPEVKLDAVKIVGS